jgi:hypothetical protein
MIEQEAFLDAAGAVPPEAVVPGTAWTAHDVVAHLTAGGAELARLLGRRAGGDLAPTTTPFAQREAPFRELPYGTLLDLLRGNALGDALQAMARDPGATLPFTGWTMTAAEHLCHMRSELALHRWDLVGSDPISERLLGQPDLTTHAVKALTRFNVIDERASERSRRSGLKALDVRLRVDGTPDVRITVDAGRTGLALTPPDDGPAVVTNAAARLLMLWGRRPASAATALSHVSADRLRAVTSWLYT